MRKMFDDTFDSTPPDDFSADEKMEPDNQNDLHEIIEDFDDIEADESFEDNFAQKIDNLSLDELNAEREKLAEMGALDGEEIARGYDAFLEEQRKQEDFNSLIDGMDAEQLHILRDKISSGDETITDILGIHDENDGTDDSANTPKLTLRPDSKNLR